MTALGWGSSEGALWDAGRLLAEGENRRRMMEVRNPKREMKTAEELAVMIHEDLSNMDGCPRLGIIVTVYGFNPWNAMLTFGVAAGPVPNKAELQTFCTIITERLQRLYDVTP
jgi:hypothetical protein